MCDYCQKKNNVSAYKSSPSDMNTAPLCITSVFDFSVIFSHTGDGPKANLWTQAQNMIKNQSLEHRNICLASWLYLYRGPAKNLSANTLEYLYVLHNRPTCSCLTPLTFCWLNLWCKSSNCHWRTEALFDPNTRLAQPCVCSPDILVAPSSQENITSCYWIPEVGSHNIQALRQNSGGQRYMVRTHHAYFQRTRCSGFHWKLMACG